MSESNPYNLSGQVTEDKGFFSPTYRAFKGIAMVSFIYAFGCFLAVGINYPIINAHQTVYADMQDKDANPDWADLPIDKDDDSLGLTFNDIEDRNKLFRNICLLAGIVFTIAGAFSVVLMGAFKTSLGITP